ncbi:hypothetical protein P4220_00040 [Pseudomonas aeruginosa]|nr:hypothetical protein [Pseudomonas aeruginosa]
MEPESAAYHIPAALALARQPRSSSALQRSFERLAQRHESLRRRSRQEGHHHRSIDGRR